MRDVGDVYFASLKRRILVGCLTLLIGVPCIGVCLAGLFMVVLPGLETMDSQYMPLVVIVALAGMMMLMLGVPLVIMVVLTMRRAKALDSIFQPLGFTGRMFMVYGRHYQGQIDRWKVDVYIYRGPTVDIRFSLPVHTRVTIVDKSSVPSAVASIFNKQPMATRDAALSSLAIFALDDAWVHELFSNPLAVDATARLMTQGAGWAIFRRLELLPGELTLNLYRSRQWMQSPLNAVDVRAWLEGLRSLAAAMQALPTPQVLVQPGAYTAKSRQGMSKALTWIIAGIVIGAPLCALAVFALAYAFASF